METHRDVSSRQTLVLCRLDPKGHKSLDHYEPLQASLFWYCFPILTNIQNRDWAALPCPRCFQDFKNVYNPSCYPNSMSRVPHKEETVGTASCLLLLPSHTLVCSHEAAGSKQGSQHITLPLTYSGSEKPECTNPAQTSRADDASGG